MTDCEQQPVQDVTSDDVDDAPIADAATLDKVLVPGGMCVFVCILLVLYKLLKILIIV